jgi:surface polysaccharide O-acyltransferase-like enzyme
MEIVQSETIDWLRPVMAFMVICLHVQLFYVDESWSMNGGLFQVFVIYLCKTICPVAVPTFFFISGFLFFNRLEDWNHEIWMRKMTKRLRTLFVPYLLWNLIAIIAFPITRFGGSILKGVPMENVWDTIKDRGFFRLFWDRTLFDGITSQTTNILGWSVPSGQPMDTPLWFVRDLIVILLFTPLIHWLIKKMGSIFVVLLALLFVVDIWIPVSGFGIKATYFFSWGSLFSIKGKSFIESFRKTWKTITLFYFASLAFIPILWEIDRQAFNLTVRVFIPISIMFYFNIVSKLLEHRRIKVNHRLASSSFFVFCSHMVIVSSAVMWAVMSLPFSLGIMRILLFIIGAVLIFLICHFMYIFLKRFCPSVLNLLTGGRNS